MQEQAIADILSSLKLRRFSLLHLFPHHFSRSGGFCENPLRSFEVFTVLEVAPLGVSVLPLHASLSACNLDIPLPTALWTDRGGIPNQLFTGIDVRVSYMPSLEDLSTGLSTEKS